MISPEEKARFAALCEEDASASAKAREGIGIYNEKSLHRICKRFFAKGEKEEIFEVKVGPFIVDLLEDGQITEVQGASFRPLREKLDYYHKEGYSVTVAHPVLADLTLLRADRETGEILRQHRYRSYERPVDVLPLLYDLRECLAKETFTLCLVLIRAEEFRYSERMRYRKKGAYESELFARELMDLLTFRTREDYRIFLPEGLPETFSATEFGKLTRLKGRRIYSALNTLVAIGLLTREKEEGTSHRFLYRQILASGVPSN